MAECAMAREKNDILKHRFAIMEECGQRLNMAMVLPQRIGDRARRPAHFLHPFRRLGPAKNAARPVFGFHDKNAVNGDNHVSDLRGAASGWNNEVVQGAIDRPV